MQLLETGPILNKEDFTALLDRIGDVKVVMLPQEMYRLYWLVQDPERRKVLYLGSPESFDQWKTKAIQ